MSEWTELIKNEKDNTEKFLKKSSTETLKDAMRFMNESGRKEVYAELRRRKKTHYEPPQSKMTMLKIKFKRWGLF